MREIAGLPSRPARPASCSRCSIVFGKSQWTTHRTSALLLREWDWNRCQPKRGNLKSVARA